MAGPIEFERYSARHTTETLKKGQAVKRATTNPDTDVEVVDAATDFVFGFATEAYAADTDCDIYREGGEAIVLAGGTVAVNGAVKINADGEVVATAAGNDMIGYALEALSDGNLGRIYFQRNITTS